MDYPDPDEEFEMLHAQELEMMREMEEEYENYSPPNLSSKSASKPAAKTKRSLDFLSPTFSQNSVNKEVNKSVNSQSSSSDLNDSIDIPDRTALQASSDGCLPFSSKRTVSDLFGDIDDILNESDPSFKKVRLEDDEQTKLETIEKILSLRQRNNVNDRSKASVGSTSSGIELADKMTKGVPKWPFMPVEGNDHQRIYLRMYSEEQFNNQIKELVDVNKTGSLLPEPFYKIQERARKEIEKKSKVMLAEANKENVDEPGTPSQDDLWVDRYKPKHYLELLSDEATNRSLLQWLKLWDKIVFNKEPKKCAKKPKPVENKFSNWAQKNSLKWKKNKQELSEELDEFGRPQFKVALLCGPPGLGKTTLAHMIAKQAGYNVVEVNASDDRSPQLFKSQLEAATKMKPVLGAEPKPNCLILDEIDGAPSQSIDVLVKFATDKEKPKGKSKKSLGILRRPIICICNDVYVPALRPLRQIAFTLHFPPTSSSRLGERLLEICKFEQINSDLGAMMALSEKTHNDIRSSLAILHCIRSKSGKRVTLSQIQNSKMGIKDVQQGLFTIWQKIFQIQRYKTKVYSADDKTVPNEPDSSMAIRMKSILQSVYGGGDYDRLVSGVFENMLSVQFKVVPVHSICSALDWFCFYDVVNSHIQTTQNYSTYAYLPYGFVVWHFIFASFNWPRLSYPSIGYEMFQKSSRTSQLLDYCILGMPAHTRSFIQKINLLLEYIPYLLELIVPNMRTVSSTLFTPQERVELNRVIGIMIDYNLNYTQERTPDGMYKFNLDPNLEEVGRFSDWSGDRILSYAGRQVVSRELEVEKLRRAEASLYKTSTVENTNAMEVVEATKTLTESNQNETTYVTPDKAANKPAVPSHLQKLTPKALKKVDMKTKDFFGRVVETSLSRTQEKAKTDEIVKSDVWFHFKEGYNNAVRKNVYMKDLY